MCSGQSWARLERSAKLSRGTKRRLSHTQERQILSVCVGIEHLLKKRCRRENKAARENVPATHPAPTRSRGNADVVKSGAMADPVCRLCESTSQVLRVARAHERRAHDTKNCEACRMWSLVMSRYNSLQRDRPSAAVNATVNTSGVDPKAGAGTPGSSRAY